MLPCPEWSWAFCLLLLFYVWFFAVVVVFFVSFCFSLVLVFCYFFCSLNFNSLRLMRDKNWNGRGNEELIYGSSASIEECSCEWRKYSRTCNSGCSKLVSASSIKSWPNRIASNRKLNFSRDFRFGGQRKCPKSLAKRSRKWTQVFNFRRFASPFGRRSTR